MREHCFLAAPSMAYADQIMSYRDESLANDRQMNGVAGLQQFSTAQAWLDYLDRNAHPETRAPGLVPDSTFLFIRETDNRLVGVINIRHELNDWLLQYGGHIGYSIRPNERRKGYAKQQLKLALAKCRDLGLDRVLVTCNENNEASRRTILANGGVMEDVRTKPTGERLQRFWITL